MKKLRNIILSLAALCALVFLATLHISAATLSYETLNNLSGACFVATTDKDPASYVVGEKMKFTIELKKGSDLVSVPVFSYTVRGEDGNSFSGTADGASGKLKLETSINCPGFVRVTVKALDGNGVEINSSVRFNGGAAAEIEKLETQMAEPDDFDEYWAKCLSELDTTTPNIYNIQKASESDSNYDVYDLYINCVGSKNFLNTAQTGEAPNGATYVSGKLTVPKNLSAGEAKFHLMFQGAGVYSSPGVVKRANTVTLSVYAHSIELSREQSYYTELERGVLSNYMKRQLYNDNADESYIKYMVLRDVQAVRFLKTFFGEDGGKSGIVNGIDTSAWQGLWDGKTISLYGQSQGGFQCIAVAALDHDISLCEPWVPCWCDMYAYKYMPSRFTLGLVYEHYSQKYFDSVSLGKRIVCKTNVYTGFGDDTCPTPGVICMYNALTCEKNLRIYQGMEHNCNTSYPNNNYSERSDSFRVSFGETVDLEYYIDSFDANFFERVDDTTLRAVKLGTSEVTFNGSTLTVKVEPAVLNFVLALGSDDFGGKDDVINGIKTGFRLRKNESAAVLYADNAMTFDTFADGYSSDIANGNYIVGDTYLFIIDDGSTSSMNRVELAEKYTGTAKSIGANATAFVAKGITYASQVAYSMQLDSEKYPNFYVTANETSSTDLERGKNAVQNLFSIIDGNMPYTAATYALYNGVDVSRFNGVNVVSNGDTIAPVVVPSPLYAIRDGIFFAVDGGLALEDGFVYSVNENGTFTIGNSKYNVFTNALAEGHDENFSWVLSNGNVLYVISDGDISSENYGYLTYASQIKEINILQGAKTVDSGAFSGMSALESIRLPYTLTNVATDAFSGFTHAELYGFENNAPTMSVAALDGVHFNSLGACGSAGAGLTWTYKDGILTVSGTGSEVSSGCTGYNTGKNSSWYNYYNSITKVILPSSVKTIDAYCFTQMNKLTTIEITESLTTIEGGAFQNCSNLKTIYVAGKTMTVGTLDLSYVTSFPGGYQFDGGTSATTIKFSDELKGSFGDKFISYNGALAEITVPQGVTSLASRAFFDCRVLKTVKILGNTTTFAGNGFGNTPISKIYGHAGSPANVFAEANGIPFEDLTGDKFDGDVELRGSCGEDVYFKLVENTDEAETYTIYFYGTGKVIDASSRPWGAYLPKITKAVFRGNIESIGENTLNGLSKLRSFELDSSAIKALNKGEFSDLSGLDEVFVIPPSITKINANAFENCTSIKAITVESSDTIIDDNAFASCTSLATVYGRPESSASTFAENNNLKFVDFNDYSSVASGRVYVENVIDVTWYYDKTEKTLTLVSNKASGAWNETGAISYAVDGKGWSAYKNEIEKVVVGDGLKKLSNNAFEGHTALKTIELSKDVYAFQLYSLSGCKNLRTIYVRGNIPLEGTADLHNITDLSGESILASCAFDTVILSKSITADNIGATAFNNVTLKAVIGTSEFSESFAGEKNAKHNYGYVTNNTVWYIDGGTLYVNACGDIKSIDDFSSVSNAVKKIVFTENCDISSVSDSSFGIFTALESVLFKCNAPMSVGTNIFGTQKASFAVYYAKGTSGFTKPVWRGYPCTEEGTALNIKASGECKSGSYSWSIDYDGVLTISGSGNGTLEFTNNVSYESEKQKNLPWYDYRSEVKKVVIEESTGIKKIAMYAFGFHPNLKEVVVPSTFTDLSEFNVFCSTPMLDTICVHGKNTEDGIIDLRNVKTVNSQAFEGSFANTTPKIYLGKTTVFNAYKFAAPCSKVTFFVYPYTTPETTIKNLIDKQSGAEANSNITKNIFIEYYSADDPDMKITGSQQMDYGHVDYEIDLTTLTLTLKPGVGAGGWNELLYNGNSSVLIQMKNEWADKIKHIVVEKGFSKIQSNGRENFFSGWSSLESIWFKDTSKEIQNGNGGLFADNPKLTTICWGADFKEGTADISGWNKWSGNAPKDVLKNCSSVTRVIFGKGENTYDIFDGMFAGCISLAELTIPKTVKNIGPGAFDCCTSLKKITLEGRPNVTSMSFPSRSDLVVYCASAEDRDAIKDSVGETETRIIFAEAISGAITLEGYKVRISSYNGLRSIFTLNKNKLKSIENDGMILKEYGIIFAAEANKESMSLTQSGSEYVTTNEKVVKREVFKNGSIVGKILSENDNEIEFAGTVINISEQNYKSNIYFRAYEVYSDENGVDQIVYTDYKGEDYKTVSLYDVCLGSYKSGIINAENDTEGIVWGILNSCAAELTADVDFKSVEGLTDLKGDLIGNKFVFKDVSACYQGESDGQLTFTESGLTISLFLDRTSGKYTAIYHGSGSVPSTSRWGYGTQQQLSSGFASVFDGGTKLVKTVGLARPNPTLTASVIIDTIVLDYGVTKIDSEGLSLLGCETVIYANSLVETVGGIFQGNNNLKTVALANGDNTVIEKGLADLSNIAKVGMYYTFNSCSSIFKIHLPGDIGNTIGAQFAQGCTSLKGIWCGDGIYTDGVADFTASATQITTVGGASLSGLTHISEVKLNNTAQNVTVSSSAVSDGTTISYIS